LSKYVDAPPAGTYRLAAQIVPLDALAYLIEPFDDSIAVPSVAALAIIVGRTKPIETKTIIAEDKFAHFLAN